MIELAQQLGLGKFGLMCAQESWRMWQGGNQWSSWSSYLSFFREVANLDIAWDKWIHWENASIHAGPRIMHAEFCIISDRPDVLLVDENNRSHADGGPFCRWRDGSSLYAHHGLRIPAYIGETPSKAWKPEWVDKEKNADVRTLLLRTIGYERWIQATGGKTVHEAVIDDLPYSLIERQDTDMGLMKFLKMKNPSVPGIYHIEPVAPHAWIKTCEDALRWREIGDVARDTNVKIKHLFIK